jgi:hypothetical protein
MKSLIVVAFLVTYASAQSLNFMTKVTAPDCAYKCTTSTFSASDSSTYTRSYFNNQRYVAKGIMVSMFVDGVDSGVIYIHPSNNSDMNHRVPLYFRKSDYGYWRPFSFDKIFRSGTTIPLDSIWYVLDLGK